MKNVFRENFSRHPNLRFRDFHQNPNDEISDFHQNYVFWKIFFIEKTRFSRKCIFFLQIHPISFYVTKYDHITPNRLGGSSRTKYKLNFFMICLILEPTRNLRFSSQLFYLGNVFHRKKKVFRENF